MKFGVFVSAQQPRSEDSVRRFREAVEQARLAKQAGFDALAAGHHYLSPPYQSLQSLPMLARLAGEAPGLELCLSVLLLAMLNPVQTAEEVASLDIMSGGKVVFGIGIGMAGLAGVLAGPMRGVYAEMGVEIIIDSFVVVVVGGMGSLPGAIVAGLVLGEIVSLTTFFAPKLAELIIFIVMAIVLLIRPSGLFGEAGLAE